jgi:large subunit ribosomal protein L25
MKILTLNGTPRTAFGKKGAKATRSAGKVPCVLYGGKEVLHFEAEAKAFKPLIYTPDVHLVKLDIAGKTADAILKDVQFHPVTDAIMHVDFLEVLSDKPVVMQIPVKFNGTAAGVKEGGQMLKKLTKLRVKGLISKIPATIEVNVEPLKIGDSIHVRDLKYEGITFLHDPAVTIVAIKISRVVQETPAVAPTATTVSASDSAKKTAEPAADAKGTAKEEKKK